MVIIVLFYIVIVKLLVSLIYKINFITGMYV